MSKKQIPFFERYLSVWVAICIAVGIGIGQVAGDSMQVLEDIEIYKVNHCYPDMAYDLSYDATDRF